MWILPYFAENLMSNYFVVLTDIFWVFLFWFIWVFLFVRDFFSIFVWFGFSCVWFGFFCVWGFFKFCFKFKGNVLVLYFGDLHFYEVEYLFLKYSAVFDNSYLEHHNRIFERNNYEMPKYLAKSSNKS